MAEVQIENAMIPDAIEPISVLIAKIKVNKIQGSLNIARSTLDALEQVINQAENTTPYALIGLLRRGGGALSRALPQRPAAANIARRVLRALRIETPTGSDQSGEVAGDSLQKLVLTAWAARRGTIGDHDLREALRDHIAELRLELESTLDSIGAQALAHIHSDAVVLVGSATPLIERFLRAAYREHTFRLVVPEGPAEGQTHGMAARLADAGLPVTVITNAAVFALMSRVTKVVISVRAAGGGGAARAAPGTLNITAAAKHYNVPVLALCPLYKLTPLHAADSASTPRGTPTHLHRYREQKSEAARVYAPEYDSIHPDHITLFITNTGGSSPSYIYRTLSELYDPADNFFD